MGQEEILALLHQNLQQEEETARMVEQSTPQLGQKAIQAAQKVLPKRVRWREASERPR